MKKIFICGSIKINEIPKVVIEILDKTIKNKHCILVGDAFGVDSSVQQYFANNQYFNLTVYTVNYEPRNVKSENFHIKHIGNSSKEIEIVCNKNTKTERNRQWLKDKAMIDNCDFALIIWNGESKGSYRNIMELINQRKNFKLYVENKLLENPTKEKVSYIFKQHRGFTLTELLEELKCKGIHFTPNKLKEFLVEHKIYINNKTPNTKDCIFIKDYNKKYNTVKYRFSLELFDMICKIAQSKQGQSLFDIDGCKI